jgi:hypothetical protein
VPIRIQMTRQKGGWRKDNPDAVIVARPSKWGNPYIVGQRVFTRRGGHALIKDRQMAADLYRRKMTAFASSYSAEMIHELRGKDLACWCPLDQPCHADVLLELANRPITSVPKDT